MAKYEGYIDLKKTIIRDSKGRRITDSYIEKSLKETEEYRKQLREGFHDEELATESYVPKANTVRAMKEAKAGRTIKVKNLKDIFKKLNKS
ncbi:MAG: hypothetical protein ACKOXS_02000 [Actinomycetes bacterium]